MNAVNYWDYLLKIVPIVLALTAAMGVVPLLVYLERVICARVQNRVGPNRVGLLGPNGLLEGLTGFRLTERRVLGGLLQPLADAVKLFTKEDVIPRGADRFLFTLAPMFALLPPLLAFAVIPLGADVSWADGEGAGHLLKLQVADLNIGLLWILSVASLSAYGLTFGGWASNNKYSLLGGVRSTAQMISYEIGMGITLLAVVMSYQTVSLREMVHIQAGITPDNPYGVNGIFEWGIFRNWGAGAFAFLLFWICAFAENNRLPFDLPECEAELVGGYHTEYSSMKFGMFFQAEYIAMIAMSCLMATLFLGGWHYPGYAAVAHWNGYVAAVLSLAALAAKAAFFILFAIVIRWTLPRFRYDQMMNLGWKVLIPLALVNLLYTAFINLLPSV